MPSKLHLLPADIAERLQELPGKVASLEGLAALWLFGSFARGEATPISDVDLAYLASEDLGGEALERFETELYSTISRTLRTDELAFAELHRVPAYFAWRVLTEGQLLFCRDRTLVAAFAEAVYSQVPDVWWLRRAGNADFLEGFGMPKPTVDKERIIEFLRLINEDVETLREKSKVSQEVYLKDRDIQAIVERRLQTMTESCINIGNHIIARLGFRAPQDYGDVFRILGEAQVLPPELVEQMVDLSKFHNLLVHVYWRLDQERVYEALPSRLAALEAFVKQIVEWLRTESEGVGS